MDPSLYDHVRTEIGNVSERSRPVPADETLAEARSGIATFTRGAPELLHWCLVNENMVLEQPLSDAKIYAGFEQVSRTRGVTRRYKLLCEAAAEVHVFGEPDWQPTFPATSVYGVESGPMLREWFLVITSERYKALLVASELGEGPFRDARERRLDGILCYHPRVVESACDFLAELVG